MAAQLWVIAIFEH